MCSMGVSPVISTGVDSTISFPVILHNVDEQTSMFEADPLKFTVTVTSEESCVPSDARIPHKLTKVTSILTDILLKRQWVDISTRFNRLMCS